MASMKRNKRSVNNCPDCGVFVCFGYQDMLGVRMTPEARKHECDPKFILRSERARDVAMAHDPDDDEPRMPPIAQRLMEGFEMLEMGEDDPVDDD